MNQKKQREFEELEVEDERLFNLTQKHFKSKNKREESKIKDDRYEQFSF